MGIDLSLRQTAAVIAIAGTNVPGHSMTCGEDLTHDATAEEKLLRMRKITEALIAFREQHRASHVFVEQYAYNMSQASRAHSMGELGGIVKNAFFDSGVIVLPVVATQARKFLFGRLPAKGAKKEASRRLKVMGFVFRTEDEGDAFIVANYGLSELGYPALSVG